MKPLSLVLLITAGACVAAGEPARGGKPPAPSGRASKTDRPPRKVVIGTVIFGPYGKYPGLDERLKVLSGLVDEMAGEAARAYPGRGLDLAILPETTVTSTH